MLMLTPRQVASPGRAKYLQLADAVRLAISDGYLQPGENLPSEAAIASMAGVSKAVVREGLAVLVSEGALEKRNGVPTRVSPDGHRRELNDERYRIEDANIAAGRRPTESAFTRGHGIDWGKYTIELEVRREVATPKDRELLQLEEGAYVWRLCWIKYADGEPVEIQRSALPEYVVEGNEFLVDPDRQPVPGGTQWELADAGFRATRVTTRARPRMPHEDEKRDLRIAQVPVLDVERVFWSGTRPVEASRLVLPGNRHELVYEATLG